MGLCVSTIAYIRLPSLKVSTLLLIGLLIYDVFWVSAIINIYLIIMQSMHKFRTSVRMSRIFLSPKPPNLNAIVEGFSIQSDILC